MSSGPTKEADDGYLPWRTIVDGRYEIVRPIGEGGMGSVYLAHDLEIDRQVALKVLTPRYVGRPEREKRFTNEARYGGRLCHRNIATTYNAGRMDNGRPYIVMEYVEGPAINVLSIAEGRKPTLLRLLELMRGVAEALAAMHRAGVVHRDLTPSNILVNTKEVGSVAKVIDFSHAAADVPRLRVGDPRRLTRAHETPGTPGYMPPEQVLSDPAAPRMDVFSFGVVLWELLSGKHAFRHLDRDQYFELQATTPTAPPSLAELRPDLPESLCALVADCTRIHIAERPSSSTVALRLGEIIEELKEQRRPSPPPVVIETVVDPGATSEIAEEPRPDPAPHQGTTSSRPQKAAIVVALCLVILIVVALLLLWGRAPEDDTDGEATPEPTPTAARQDEPEHIVIEEPRAFVADVGVAETIEETPAPSIEPLPPKDSETELPEPAPRTSRPKHSRPTRTRATKRSQPTAQECQQARTSAQNAEAKADWKEVLKHTKDGTCWSGPERTRLRVTAMLELSRFRECVREGKGSTDPQVVKVRKACEGLVR